MFCNSCNNGNNNLWLIILILFGGCNGGYNGCGNNCGCNNNCGCGCNNDCGCC